MEIGLRQSYVSDFKTRFPKTAGFLQNRLETVYAGSFEELGSKPDEYKFQLDVEYYPQEEEDKPAGELITTPNGKELSETRTLSIIGHYPGRYGDTRTALLVLNLTKPNVAELLEEEAAGINPLFEQVKSYPLDSVPKEI